MKKIFMYLLFVTCFSNSWSQETTQNSIENEKYLSMSPYESMTLTYTELLKFYESIDQQTLMSLGVNERATLECQKKCVSENIKINKKYQTLDPTYTNEQMYKGITSAYSEAWSEEISKCNCEKIEQK